MSEGDIDRIKRSLEATRYLLQSGSSGPDVTEKVMYAQDVGCLLAEVRRLRLELAGADMEIAHWKRKAAAPSAAPGGEE